MLTNLNTPLEPGIIAKLGMFSSSGEPDEVENIIYNPVLPVRVYLDLEHEFYVR